MDEIMKENPEILVSVVMPSYNRYPLNLYALQSLQKQTFPCSQMEVIFVDDGSSDETPNIRSQLTTPYSLKWIRNESPLGRSKARNLGVEHASGRIIVFLDAEMIAAPTLIETHYLAQNEQDGLVVSGCLELKRLYTMLFPGFNLEQISQLHALYGDNRQVLTLIDQFYLDGSSSPITLLTSEEMTNMEILEKRSYGVEYYNDILNQFGNELEGFRFSWINFCSGNVSVSKELFIKAGGFDESFVGFGLEDWDLGYRLHKQGTRFIHDKTAIAYHQEHPISLYSNWQEHRKNLYTFQAKYKEIEPKLLILSMVPAFKKNLIKLNRYAFEYEELRRQFPSEFTLISDTITSLLSHAALLVSEQKDIIRLTEEAGVSVEILDNCAKAVKKVRKRYPKLAELYEFLIIL
ncbi:glycosyltransferase family 2 protein [Peribacillus deserti]|uniref:Glycosyl transferase n=1 Tax=Peribacillus deserti TaxID=673318 RepID=A0A2N5M0A6_9BACI|nr:glycosyltransferase family 2 protein [Peribacillus deserti]PLT27788.1 hypothetical protein CUU66_22005 [Peribacillus deserti]